MLTSPDFNARYVKSLLFFFFCYSHKDGYASSGYEGNALCIKTYCAEMMCHHYVHQVAGPS